MYEFKNIFQHKESWKISKNEDTGFVVGIIGKGNNVFDSIKVSINKYLGNSSGSVIDFHLLKDTIDRHCDSVENDINVQTPIPLYCGLAGTMAGIILGLWPLVKGENLTALLNGSSTTTVASDINELLSGVAFAMVASICGIVFTTISSLLFKRYKLKEESGKNTFLVWMQSCLLPELPTDTSEALNNLVTNLNVFNNTFAQNTNELRCTLAQVNEAYRIQADVIQAVHDMDVMRMATANVRVLEALSNCTDRLETFNQYLMDVQGYTDAIHLFTSQFEQESNRLHILEEIRDFFTRHKAEISRSTTDADNALRGALNSIQDNARSHIEELNRQLTVQSNEFKRILQEEQESFEQINQEMITAFHNQAQDIPALISNIEKVATIPAQIDKLIEKIELSNRSLGNEIVKTMNQTIQSVNGKIERKVDSSSNLQLLPRWMTWTIVISAIIIALACVTNTVYNIIKPPVSIGNVQKKEYIQKGKTTVEIIDEQKTDTIS